MAEKERKKANFFEKRSFILVVASVAFLCFSTVLVINLVSDRAEKKREYESISQENSSLEELNSKLENELQSGISDEEKEHIARDELGYILPGEHVYADAS